MEMKELVWTVKLTNSVAERRVKLISDYADILTIDIEKRKKWVLAVQRHRRDYRQGRKKDLNDYIEKNSVESFDEWSADESDDTNN